MIIPHHLDCGIRVLEDWRIGGLEWWEISNTPILHHSNPPTTCTYIVVPAYRIVKRHFPVIDINLRI
jgi:hypothetical protein